MEHVSSILQILYYILLIGCVLYVFICQYRYSKKNIERQEHLDKLWNDAIEKLKSDVSFLNKQ